MVEKTERINLYLIGSGETSFFESDIYFVKKIKSLTQEEIGLDAVFVKEPEKFPIVKRYCLKHQIETINFNTPENKNYFHFLVHYTQNNPDKKNLATLVSNAKALAETLKLNWLFKQNNAFDTYII